MKIGALATSLAQLQTEIRVKLVAADERRTKQRFVIGVDFGLLDFAVKVILFPELPGRADTAADLPALGPTALAWQNPLAQLHLFPGL